MAIPRTMGVMPKVYNLKIDLYFRKKENFKPNYL